MGISNFLKNHREKPKKIIGVTLGWGFQPQLCFEDQTVYFKSSLDKLLHPEYFLNNEE